MTGLCLPSNSECTIYFSLPSASEIAGSTGIKALRVNLLRMCSVSRKTDKTKTLLILFLPVLRCIFTFFSPTSPHFLTLIFLLSLGEFTSDFEMGVRICPTRIS